MALKITKDNDLLIFENTETGIKHPYLSRFVEGRLNDDGDWYFIHQLGDGQSLYPFAQARKGQKYTFNYSEITDSLGQSFSSNDEVRYYLADLSTTNTMSWQYDVALGNIPNATAWNKFGYNLDVDSGTEEIVASWGGSFDPNTDVMSTDDTFTITYNNTTDGQGQTGATQLLFYYLDADFLPAVAFHTLGSTGSDVTSFTGFGINRCVVYANGGDGYNANDITVTATTDGTTQAQIPAEESTTQQCIYHTAIGYTLPLEWLKANVRKVTSGGSRVRYTIKGYSWSRVTQTRYEILRYDGDTDIEDGFQLNPSLPFVVGGREVVYFTCLTDTNNTVVNLRFSGIESKNT